jgi:uncharacterized protein (DUF1499 family)
MKADSKMRLHSTLTILAVLAMTVDTSYGATMPPCPSSPNCVSSQAEDSHRIAPLYIAGDPDKAFERLKMLLTERSDTSVVSSDMNCIRVEFRTLLGFVDDGLFLLNRKALLIDVRSSARLGYWDMGKNRRRLEEVREQFVAPDFKQ